MSFFTLLLLFEFIFFALVIIPTRMTRRLLRSNRPLKALSWAKTTLAISHVVPSLRGVGNLNVAACYLSADNAIAAQPYAEKAVAHYDRHASPRLNANRALSSAYLGLTFARAGQYQEAEELVDSALTLTVRNTEVRALTQINAAGVYLNRGRLADAARLMEQVLAMPKVSDDFRLMAEIQLAAQRYYSEDFAGGLAMARQAMQRKTMTLRLTTQAAALAEACLIELGDLREAQNLDAGILAQISDAPRPIQNMALLTSAHLALKLGNLDRAREMAERAAPLSPAPNAQAACLLIQAEVFALRQNSQRAASLIDAVLHSDAIDFYQRRARALQARLSAPVVPALQ